MSRASREFGFLATKSPRPFAASAGERFCRICASSSAASSQSGRSALARRTARNRGVVVAGGGGGLRHGEVRLRQLRILGRERCAPRAGSPPCRGSPASRRLSCMNPFSRSHALGGEQLLEIAARLPRRACSPTSSAASTCSACGEAGSMLLPGARRLERELGQLRLVRDLDRAARDARIAVRRARSR